MDLLRDLDLQARGDGVYERTCDRRWWGHDALFGGYAQALSLRAMRLELADEAKVPKSVTTHFLRPFPDGPFRVEVEVEREGREMASLSARAWAGGKLAGVSIANFGTNRATESFLAAAPPAVTSWDPAELDVQPGAGIATHALFDLFPRLGGLRLGSGEATVGGWVRPRFSTAVDEYLCVILADLWLPAAYHRWSRGTRAVSADITVHFRAPFPIDDPATTPLLVVLDAATAGHGWADEDGEIWTADGRLLAQSRQVRYVFAG